MRRCVRPTPRERQKTSASISTRTFSSFTNLSGSALLPHRCSRRSSIKRLSTFPLATTLSGLPARCKNSTAICVSIRCPRRSPIARKTKKMTKAKAAHFPRLRRDKRSAWTRFVRTSTSPNRRRGSTTPPWLRSSRKTVSGGPRLTLPSFQPSSSANTSPRIRDVFHPPCSASVSACF